MVNDSHLMSAILLTSFIAALSPGPDFALVMRNSMLHSRRSGVETAIGLALGVTVHVSYCIFLISYLLSSTYIIVIILKYLGAAYLAWIGIKSLHHAKLLYEVHRAKNEETSLPNILRRPKSFILSGFLCNLLNPKAVLFFISIFTFLIAQDVSEEIKIFSGIGMVLITLIWFSALSWLITHARFRRFFTGYRFQTWVNGIMGVIFLTFALILLLIHI